MKNFRGLIIMLLISLTMFGLTACGGENSNSYEQITAKQAKNIMDTESDYIIIDSRTTEEFAEGHIENAILIPNTKSPTEPKRNCLIRTSLFSSIAVAADGAKSSPKNWSSSAIPTSKNSAVLSTGRMKQ